MKNSPIYVGRPPEREVSLGDVIIVLVLAFLACAAVAGCGGGGDAPVDRAVTGGAPGHVVGQPGGDAGTDGGAAATGGRPADGGAGDAAGPWIVPGAPASGLCVPAQAAADPCATGPVSVCPASLNLPKACQVYDPGAPMATVCVSAAATCGAGAYVTGVCDPGGGSCSIRCALLGYPVACADSAGSMVLCCRP